MPDAAGSRDDDVGVLVERDVADAPSTSKPASASKPCAFFARGRCGGGTQCPFSHAPSVARARATHASNCGCLACNPTRANPRERGARDADGASSSESEEEGAVPSAVVEREARERAAERAETLRRCGTIADENRCEFWREFLREASSGRGNRLVPYWTREDDAPPPATGPRPRPPDVGDADARARARPRRSI